MKVKHMIIPERQIFFNYSVLYVRYRLYITNNQNKIEYNNIIINVLIFEYLILFIDNDAEKKVVFMIIYYIINE